MKHWRLLPVLLTLAFPALAHAEGEATTPPKPKGTELGQKVDFSGTTFDGKEFKLSDVQITKEKAWEAVKAAAVELGAPADVKPETKVTEVPGLKDEEGAVDEELLTQLVAKSGARFGLVVDPEEDLTPTVQTLGQIREWIEKAANTPIVVLVWSPNCPACKNGGDERLMEILGENPARLVVLDSDFKDTPQQVKDYLDGHGWAWRVVMDNEQKITDVVGGERTPHAFLLDKDFVLRYRGAVARPPDAEKGETEAKQVLRDAIQSVQKGEKPAVETSEPVG